MKQALPFKKRRIASACMTRMISGTSQIQNHHPKKSYEAKAIQAASNPNQANLMTFCDAKGIQYLHADDLLKLGAAIPSCDASIENPRSIVYKAREYIVILERQIEVMRYQNGAAQRNAGPEPIIAKKARMMQR